MRIFLYIATTAIMSCVTSQIFKLCLNAFIEKKKATLNELFQDGSFPSSHSSYITSISVVAWINVLANQSKEYTEVYLWIAIVATVYATIVIRDALGVRYTVQKLCDAFLLMIEDTTKANEDKMLEIARRLKKKSGHEPHEVVGGIIWGAFIALFTSSIYYENSQYLICLVALMVAFVISAYWYIRIRKKR